MTKADRGAFASQIRALCAAFRIEPNELLLQAYWTAVQSLTVDELHHAVNRAVAELDRMPSAAHIRKLGRPTTVTHGVDDTAAKLKQSMACKFHQERQDVVQEEYYSWCWSCRRNGDQDPGKTQRMHTEIRQWLRDWAARNT